MEAVKLNLLPVRPRKGHLGFRTIENPELLGELDQRSIDQTISLSAAYNDARALFKSSPYGMASVCMDMPHCRGLMCAGTGPPLGNASPFISFPRSCFHNKREVRSETRGGD